MSRSPLPLLFGLIGRGVASNPTQQMFEAAFFESGVAAQYVTLDIHPQDLRTTIRGLRAMNFSGFHVTMPYKIAVTPLLGSLSASARVIGAVNTVVARDGELVGENTDGRGFVEALEQLSSVSGASVLILGAGGAARAIAVEVANAGAANVVISNRTFERADQLSTVLVNTLHVPSTTTMWPPDTRTLEAADIVVNATPIGMDDSAVSPPVVWPSNGRSKIAADVVIASKRTRFLETADQSGYSTMAGVQMLVEQALIGFRLWTGIEADRSVIESATLAALEIGDGAAPK